MSISKERYITLCIEALGLTSILFVGIKSPIIMVAQTLLLLIGGIRLIIDLLFLTIPRLYTNADNLGIFKVVSVFARECVIKCFNPTSMLKRYLIYRVMLIMYIVIFLFIKVGGVV